MADELFLDIETTDLKADIGQLTAVGILKNGNLEIRFADRPEDEAEVLRWFKEMLKGCRLIITWNGKNFDIPFLLTRALILGVELPELTQVRMLDLCEFCKERFLMAKYSLVEVSRSLGIKKKDEINWKSMGALYLDAIRGNERAKTSIIEHCRSDILALKAIFERLKPYIQV